MRMQKSYYEPISGSYSMMNRFVMYFTVNAEIKSSQTVTSCCCVVKKGGHFEQLPYSYKKQCAACLTAIM